MATHPKTAALNGHGNSSGGRLDRLLAHHEQAAAAVRLTISLLNGHEKTTKANGHSTVLAQAIALDGARVAKQSKTKKPKGRPNDRAAVLAQRARSAQLLDTFDTKTPRPAEKGAARGFASGTPEGLAAWLVLSSEALHAGAREALNIAASMSS